MAAIAMVFGVLLVLGSFVHDTAPAGTHNLGLMQQQMMILQTGIGLVVTGAILSLKTAGVSAGRTSDVAAAPEVSDEVRASRQAYAKRENRIILLIGAIAVVAMIFMAKFAP